MIQLGEICTKASSNIAQKDLETCDGIYPIYGASGLIKHVNFYQRETPYIAVVKDGAGVGRVMQLPAKSSVIGTMQYILPNDSVNVSYLAYAMEYLNLAKYCTGATIPHIYFKDYCKELLQEHNIEEQLHIAFILDKIKSLISLRKQQLAKLDELVKARFVEMFGGIHESKMYPYKSVSEITSVISGGTPIRAIPEYWEHGDIPWVKTTELQNNRITAVDEHITRIGLDNSAAKIVPAGTILIAMYGQGRTRGMTAYLDIEASTNQACACILPVDMVNQIYLWQYFVFSYEKLRNMAKGGNQPNLSSDIIKQFPVLAPPKSLQDKFSSFFERTHRHKLTIQQNLDKLEVLKKSLMQEYFG